MKNGDKPVYPVRGATNVPFTKADDYEEYVKQCDPTVGLTKREYFAAMAMQGLCGNEYQASESHSNDKAERVAKWAVKLANELLKQLEA